MEEICTSSSDLEYIFFSANINSIELRLLSRIKDLKDNVSDRNFIEINNICDDVKDQVLDCDDESQLSKTQNNYKRITVGSNLLINICSLYGYFTDYEYTDTVYNILSSEKFKAASKMIKNFICIEQEKEKNYIKEAKQKLIKLSEENKEIDKAVKTELFEPSSTLRFQENNEFVNTSANGSLLTDNPDQTTIRRTIAEEKINLLLDSGNILEKVSLASALAETSIEQSHVDNQFQEDIHKVSHILVDGVLQSPDNSFENTSKFNEESERKDKCLEVSNGWSLPSLQDLEEPKKKRRHLIIDNTIKISNYAARALHLNNHITMKRIQVYEGPPKILRAISVDNMMKSQSCRSSLFQDIRNDRLNKNFQRHLLTNQVTQETPHTLQNGITHDQRKIPTFQSQINGIEKTEEWKESTRLQGVSERREYLSEVIPERIPPHSVSVVENIPNGIFTNGMILPPVEAPPEIKPTLTSSKEKPADKVSQSKSFSWFYISEKNPSSPKLTEFAYVEEKLKKYWISEKSNGSITLKQFLNFEENLTTTNFLVLLRILDKLSLERKLVLTHKNGEIFIEFFRIPYVSLGQFVLTTKKPVF